MRAARRADVKIGERTVEDLIRKRRSPPPARQEM